MSLRDWLFGLWEKEKGRTTAGWLGKKPTGPGAGQCYFMIRCADVSLRLETERFTDRNILLQSVVSVQHDDQELQIPATIGPEAFKQVGQADDFQRIVLQNIPLTGWIPYNGGHVRLLAGLLGAPGGNIIGAAANFLGSVSELVHVPQLSAAVAVANKIATGAQDLLDTGKNKSYVAAYIGLDDNEIGDGYYLFANSAETAIDPDMFKVDDDNNNLVRLDGSEPPAMDYVLLQVMIRFSIGDQWNSIADIRTPFKQALEIKPSAADKADVESLLHAALVAARFSPDLTTGDQGRVRELIRKSFDEWNASMSSSDGGMQSMEGIEAARTPSMLLDTEMER